MSFEGYTLSLCEKGHIIESSPYENYPKRCPKCLAPVIMNETCSTTNGDEEEAKQNALAQKKLDEKREEILRTNPDAVVEHLAQLNKERKAYKKIAIENRFEIEKYKRVLSRLRKEKKNA